jgi:hypothetical protein
MVFFLKDWGECGIRHIFFWHQKLPFSIESNLFASKVIFLA